MKKNKGQFFLFLLILSLPGCIHRRHVDRQKLHIDMPSTQAITHTHNAPPITIWVHGTLIIYTPSYHKIFGKQECMLPVDAFPEGHHFREIAETISHHDPEHFPLEEFYVFGWSGKLRQQEREKAAAVLHEEIIKLRNAYEQKYGCTPIIRIIAHSHGGNVALSMAKLKPLLRHPSTSSGRTDEGQALIKSLILLACPVQERTKHLICTPMFNHVYSLYSSFDVVQILAPQIRRLCTKYECPHKHHKYHYTFMPFSNRIFPTYSHLTQTKVKINDLPISHTKFSSTKFVALLPTILQKLDLWHEETLANNTISKHKLLCVYNK